MAGTSHARLSPFRLHVIEDLAIDVVIMQNVAVMVCDCADVFQLRVANPTAMLSVSSGSKKSQRRDDRYLLIPCGPFAQRT